MPDEMLPIEKNARRLIGVLLQYFPDGGTSTDLLRRFQTEASLARQSFYSALSYSKKRGWIIKGERDRLYKASPDGTWREEPIVSVGASIGAGRDRGQLEYLVGAQTQQIDELRNKVERLLNWTGSSDTNGENVALANLVRIVGDDAASVRQRLKAAGAILGYRVQDDSVVEFTKRFLQSACVSADNVDYQIEASELLRKYEAPRVISETVRPAYRDDSVDAEPPEPLAELVARRRERQERREREREALGQAVDMSDTVELPPQVE